MPRKPKSRPIPSGSYLAQFHDEVPRLGSGWRIVTVRLRGRKWVHLRAFALDFPFRMPKDKWADIERSARPLP